MDSTEAQADDSIMSDVLSDQRQDLIIPRTITVFTGGEQSQNVENSSYNLCMLIIDESILHGASLADTYIYPLDVKDTPLGDLFDNCHMTCAGQIRPPPSPISAVDYDGVGLTYHD